MRSPVAPEVEMLTISIEGITVEQCPHSGGHWLDRGELAKLAKRATDVQIVGKRLESEKRDLRLCPKDVAPLDEVEFTLQAPLHIDICPVCGGIWLDAAELSQALTMLGRPNEPSVEPEVPASAPHKTPNRSVLDLLARLVNRN